MISVPDERSGEAAKAFVRLKNGADLDEDKIKYILSGFSNRHEVPKFIEIVDEELPKTAVGKPDWKKLQDEERAKLEAAKLASAARNLAP